MDNNSTPYYGSDTQRIPPVHLASSDFFESCDMEITQVVETPKRPDSGALRLPDGRTITPKLPELSEQEGLDGSEKVATPSEQGEQPLPPLPPLDPPIAQYQQPYTVHPLPRSSVVLAQLHAEECATLHAELLIMFTVLILTFTACLFSLKIFVAAAIVLCLFFLLMNFLKGGKAHG